MQDVFATWQRARAVIDHAEGVPDELEREKEELERSREAYEACARELSACRHEAAPLFCKKLKESVAELAMEGAAFEFSFEDLSFERWGEYASERVELLYQPSPASKPRPLKRIASGGELSRILLALECMHYEQLEPGQGLATIVFDEVDAGIGGATANAVAKKLDELSDFTQVIVVTHLAQVAALADEHYVVTKEQIDEGLPRTCVKSVTAEKRVSEIARMLSGFEDEAALEHARSLLAGAVVQ